MPAGGVQTQPGSVSTAPRTSPSAPGCPLIANAPFPHRNYHLWGKNDKHSAFCSRAALCFVGREREKKLLPVEMNYRLGFLLKGA